MEKANKTPKPISQLNYDHEVSIATASSRMAKQWKNENLSVLDFVQRLQKNVVTKETIDEYLAFPKSEQDTIKDVGAFVGGTLKGGRRRKEDVANRSLLTFDLDYGNRKTIDKIKKHFKNFCFTVYSTHKHTTHKPRLRLILYPDRVMLPDEFQAAMRKLGEKIDMDSIDDGSYDVNRLFYWPSSSADGDVVFYHNDKPFVQVDDVLSEYGKDEAWKDVTLWPTSSRESKKLKQLLSKQADPLTKPGFVGAFCRVISIRDAIEKHLEGTYKKEGKDRYTYADGTSTNGLVVYDEKFAYSNHDSDPSSGQLCNAFDLIRIHQFGHEDANAKAGTPANRMPSFTAMMEWCHTLDGVKEELVKGSIDPAEFDVFDEEDGGKWLAKLQTRNTGEVKPTFFNAVHIMKHDPQLKERMKWNEFSYGMEKMDGTPWENEDSFNVREYIGSVYAADFPENKIEHAMQNQALVNSYHPVQNYLKSLEWDGQERLETLFIDYFGVQDNLYVREATACWFTAAVNRIFNPGFKFDTSIVISGAQGIGKTSFIRELGLRKWYGELSTFDPKIAVEEILGKWIIEISEMGATNKQELEAQKSFLSACHTRTRLAYERRAADYKRQCVFIGSTNESQYLKDSTGNRRWWPMDAAEDVGFIDLEKLQGEVDQIWAEAYLLYAQGRTTFLSDEAREIAEVAQEEKREEDLWQGVIDEWLAEDVPVDRYDTREGAFNASDIEERKIVCVKEIWEDCLGMNREPKAAERRRIGSIMKRFRDWKSVSSIRFGKRFGIQRGWEKNASDLPF